ncbi:MAG: Na/Pi cotransporter family protein [Bacteroidales bacterium]|nr:Na/Pi cotransporter family protein [Bacteroidales bacterium]
MSEFIINIGKILTLVGALGLFLYGMKLMSEALQKVAGGKMRQILAAMTNNRIKGVLTGILVTTTIQSSSATTVMVVSFVNAGLISLVASVGIIMGANIGTTVTAWIIATLGFKVSLSFLSLPLIGISFPLFFSKNSVRKSWGEFIIGFAILFIGLQFMKESVPGINGEGDALSFLTSFINLGYLSTLIFVLVGTILTIIIQSSSATMALTLVMTYNGLIPFELAAAMVLGENIGTTVTANLAAVVANVSAKRTARAHLIFNIFGVTWVLLIFPYFLRLIDLIMMRKHGVSILDTNISKIEFNEVRELYPIGLALFHTVFNVMNTIILFGFAPFIAKIATKMVPDDGEDDEEFRLKFIDSSLFSTSEIGIVQAKEEIALFGERIQKMFTFTQNMMAEKESKLIDKLLVRVSKYEEITDALEVEIAEYLTKISEGEISRDSSKKIRAMLKMVDDMESIGDAIYQLSKVMEGLRQSKLKFTEDQLRRISEMFALVYDALEEMNNNLKKEFLDVDISRAYEIEARINEMRNKLRQQHFDDLKEKKYRHKVGSFYRDMYSISERLGDYIINISEAIEEYQ